MREIIGFPPNYREIARLFPVRGQAVIFAYGDTVYLTNGATLTEPLRVHEAVHIDRQRGRDPADWWRSYLTSPTFRFAEELPAHRAEWRAEPDHLKAKALGLIAARLAGPLYGRMVTADEAKRLIET